MTAIAEKYSRAIQSRDLKVKEQPCDADMLIASGWAAQGSNRISVNLWRMKVTGDLSSFASIARGSAEGLRKHISRQRNMAGMSEVAAFDLARGVLRMWLYDTCQACEGRGHPLVPNSHRLDTSRQCQRCNGTGKRAIESNTHTKYRDHVRWLASEFDRRSVDVFCAMAEILRRDI